MNQAIGGKNIRREYIPFLSKKIRNYSACFFYHQTACRSIPRFEFQFPETIKTAGRKISKV